MNSRSDAILPVTRVVAAIVIPFLWLAFLILYFFPETTGERFAWLIKPPLTALYMGSGYLGGSWFFINALFGKRWHRIQGGYLAITSFTWFMLLATFLFWERFVHENLGFIIWLALYLVTPFLVPAIWLYNRKTLSREPEADDVSIPPSGLWVARVIAVLCLLFVLIGLVNPDAIIKLWPWSLSPLTAFIMCGWISLLGVGAIAMSTETRWSGWKVALESIGIWHILVLTGAAVRRDEFTHGFVNWYTIMVALLVAGIVSVYLVMERLRREPRKSMP